jgi:hypothetical protein
MMARLLAAIAKRCAMANHGFVSDTEYEIYKNMTAEERRTLAILGCEDFLLTFIPTTILIMGAILWCQAPELSGPFANAITVTIMFVVFWIVDGRWRSIVKHMLARKRRQMLNRTESARKNQIVIE